MFQPLDENIFRDLVARPTVMPMMMMGPGDRKRRSPDLEEAEEIDKVDEMEEAKETHEVNEASDVAEAGNAIEVGEPEEVKEGDESPEVVEVTGHDDSNEIVADRFSVTQGKEGIFFTGNFQFKQVQYSCDLDESYREGKDLIYERMAMRSEVFPSRNKDISKPIGGGIYEKMLLESSDALTILGRENNFDQGFGIELDLMRAESRGNFSYFPIPDRLRYIKRGRNYSA